MGILNFLKPKPSVERLTKNLVTYIYKSVETDKGVRVEDALCVIATIVAERCIQVANEFSIDEHDFEPGSVVFSDKMNEILVGSIVVEDWNHLPPNSIFARIKRKIDSHFEETSFPELIKIVENYVANVNTLAWGTIHLNIPEENKPLILPLQAGYETRAYVDENINTESNEKMLRVIINALCRILIETKNVISPTIALTLTFEMINGMSKTATMTHKKWQVLEPEIVKK